MKRLRGLNGPILITGHTGFKGYWMTQLLITLEIPVVGFSLPPTQDSIYDRAKATGQIEEFFGDIANFTQLQNFIEKTRPAAIVHMAAQPLVLSSYETPLKTFETNGLGTANLLEAARKSKTVKQVIAVTTDKVYRNDNLERRFIESDPLGGKDPYSASKVASEAAVSAWQQISRVENGTQITSVRAGNVIGGGDWSKNRLMPDSIRSLSANESILLRNPHSTRPWQHVLDPLVGYLLTLCTLQEGTTVDALNFGPEEKSLTALQVAEIAAKTWGNESKITYSADSYSENLESKFLELDSRKARELLGWKPRWTQVEAVVKTTQWWKLVLSNEISVVDAVLNDISEYFA